MEIQYLKGVGPALAKKLEKLNLKHTHDTLYFFPASYQDRRIIPPIKSLQIDKPGFIQGKVESISESIRGKFSLTYARLVDESGQIQCIWFNQPYIKKVLKPGARILVNGKAEYDFSQREKTFKVSDYEWLDGTNTGIVMPVYSLTSGVYQKQLRTIIKNSLEIELPLKTDPIPEGLRRVQRRADRLPGEGVQTPGSPG